MALLLLALILVPLTAYRRAHASASPHKFAIVGIAWGLVASPFSLGLYSLGSTLPLVGAALGTAWLWSLQVHALPGQAAAAVGLVATSDIAGARAFLITSLFDAVVWAIFYGAIGYFADRAIKRRG